MNQAFIIRFLQEIYGPFAGCTRTKTTKTTRTWPTPPTWSPSSPTMTWSSLATQINQLGLSQGQEVKADKDEVGRALLKVLDFEVGEEGSCIEAVIDALQVRYDIVSEFGHEKSMECCVSVFGIPHQDPGPPRQRAAFVGRMQLPSG